MAKLVENTFFISSLCGLLKNCVNPPVKKPCTKVLYKKNVEQLLASMVPNIPLILLSCIEVTTQIFPASVTPQNK